MSEGRETHPVMRWTPSPSMVVALIALFISLTGVAWAAISQNSVRSKHIKDGQVKEPDIGPGAVTTGKVADESLIGDDLSDETVTGSKIVDGTIGGSKIDDETITGADLQDGSLGGDDIDESSLAGLVAGSGGATCCSIKTALLDIGVAHSPGNPNTFVELGGTKFELRTGAAADDDRLQLCDTTGSNTAVLAYVYLSGARSTAVFDGAPRCEQLDINGAGNDSFVGDVEILLTNPSLIVWGSSTTTGVMPITVLDQ